MSGKNRLVEELLQKTEKMIKKKNTGALKSQLQPDSDTVKTERESSSRVSQLESDLCKMIEQHPFEYNDKKKDKNFVGEQNYEGNQNQLQNDSSYRNYLFSQCIGIPEMDDPIQKNSSRICHDNVTKIEDITNLKQEVVNVSLLPNFVHEISTSTLEPLPCGSNIDTDDFSTLLKLFGNQSEREQDDCSLSSVVNQFDLLKGDNYRITQNISPISRKTSEKRYRCQLSENFESPAELKEGKIFFENLQKDPNTEFHKKNNNNVKNTAPEVKKVLSNNNELYTVGLTPRLELFADAIPKLLAEKSNETAKRICEQKQDFHFDVSATFNDNQDFSFKNLEALDVYKKIEILKDHKFVTDVKDYNDFIRTESSLTNGDFYSHFDNESKNSSDHKTSEGSSKNEDLKNQTVIEKFESSDQLLNQTNTYTPSLGNLSNPIKIENQKQHFEIHLPKKSLLCEMNKKPRIKSRKNFNKIKMERVKKEPIKSSQKNFCLDVRGSSMSYDCFATFENKNYSQKKILVDDESINSSCQNEMPEYLPDKMGVENQMEICQSKLTDHPTLDQRKKFTLQARLEKHTKHKEENTVKDLKYDPKLLTLQKEINRQENLIKAYESQNKKMIQEMKQLQLELKLNNEHKRKHTHDNKVDTQSLFKKIEDNQEEGVKVNTEMCNLKQSNRELLLKNDDLFQQVSLLQEELGMIKDQLRAKNDFITNRLQSMTTNELELRKQVEDLKVELNSKTEQLKMLKLDSEQFQLTVAPTEKELIDLRIKCSYFQEKLQTAKLNCEREKQLTQKLKDQVIIDNKNIMDLNRQIREMERILKRKNPDSVSALILSANSEKDKFCSKEIKLLEDRVAFLENEIKVKETMAEKKLSELQQKFIEMKQKYSTQLLDLDEKLKATSDCAFEKKKFKEVESQTIPVNLGNRESDQNLSEKLNANKPGPKSQNLKEDTHLIATIRGLKQELIDKDKTISKVTKELQELQKTNRKLQKEREKLLSDRRNLETAKTRIMASSDSKLSNFEMRDCNDSSSSFYKKGHSLNGKKSSSLQKLFDSTSLPDKEYNIDANKVKNENVVLKEELSKTNKDFVALKNKRLHDLNLLQKEHEKEIALIIKEYSVKAGDSHALQLQSSQQLQVLEDKIIRLQQRHESREVGLRNLVLDLLHNQSIRNGKECWIQNATDQNKDSKPSCYFQRKLDNILGILQDLTTV